MRRTVYVRAVVGLLLVLVTLMTAVPVDAQPRTQDDIQERLEEIARMQQELADRESTVRGDIAERDAVRNALTIELEELQAILDEVQTRADAAGAVLARVQRRVDAKQASIRHAQETLEDHLDALRGRAKHVYKRGPANYLDMMLNVKDFGSFLRTLAFMTHLADQDNKDIDEVTMVKRELTKQRDEIAKLRDVAARQASIVNIERARAASVVNQVESRRSAVSGDLQARVAELGSIQAQKEKFERETAELQSESAAIAAFLRGRGDTPAQVSPKGMTWPTSGPVTSGFGWRTHPIFGTRRFHAGIDIGAPTGNPIVAAGTGTVIFAGSKSGYGNATIIDHGGGIATLYGHQSSIAVGVGTKVGIGQAIGGVGCTGYCTGPHLHFEVRVNGDPVDPMGWLP